ncbi:monooxygenase [Penicillium herquei]|nr:monooxygenase [Penicillium herquei]
MTAEKTNFRVLIVGGSVAGLTLAHCLRHNNIDFTVLEGHHDIAPEVGASIGILPNGARILDQLGMYDDVLNAVEPLKQSWFWDDSGELLSESNAPVILMERHGYPIAFLDRQTLLQILYAHLQGDQGKVLTSKRVINLEQFPTHVVAHCKDGSSYEGDLVIGADGVHSTIRNLMWNYMEAHGLSEKIEQERKVMTSEYDCVFGISDATPGLVPGHAHRTFSEGYSLLVISSKNGRVYWFFFTKMDRKYLNNEIPRFSKEKIDEHVAPWLHKPVTGSVSFSEIYHKATIKTHLALEEADYTYWCKDRWACIGDSIHKMTPNAGQGGNSAIESAASLTNHLVKLLQHKTTPNVKEIDLCLQAWQEDRRSRAKTILKSANSLTRIEACATFKDKLIALKLLPFLGSVFTNITSAGIIEAEFLESLPLPPRALSGTMPFLNRADVEKGKSESLWMRSVSCIPLFACFGAARATIVPLVQKLRQFMIPFFVQGSWAASNGELLDMHKSLYKVPFLEKLLRPLTLCFLPSITGSDPVSRAQMIPFMADVGAMYGIWILESCRKSHSPSEVALPIITGTVYQLKGVGICAPLYYALEYLRVHPSKLLSRVGHEVEARKTLAILASLLVGYYLPTYKNFTASGAGLRQSWNAIWQFFPIVVPVIAAVISQFQRKSTQPSDQQESRDRTANNMAAIRVAYIGLAAISGATWIYSVVSAPAGSSMIEIFWPGLDPHSFPVTSFADGIARFLKYDQLWAMASSFVWLGLRAKELKKRGASFSWWTAASAFVGTMLSFGPGTVFALGWGWREELMNKMSAAEEKIAGDES